MDPPSPLMSENVCSILMTRNFCLGFVDLESNMDLKTDAFRHFFLYFLFRGTPLERNEKDIGDLLSHHVSLKKRCSLCHDLSNSWLA